MNTASNENSLPTQTNEMKIGKMTYTVVTHFSESGETAEQKLLRYVTQKVADEMKNSESKNDVPIEQMSC